jgi:membrane protein implicated in regulation of membrane protease activity
MLGSALALAAIAALALFSLWGLLLAATAAGLLALGWSWAATLTVLAAANALLVFGSLWLMRRSLAHIGIERTRHALGLDVSHVSE